MLAEITPALHHKSTTCFENHNLKRHWITSFTLVEHEESMLPFSKAVKSLIFEQKTNVCCTKAGRVADV